MTFKPSAQHEEEHGVEQIPLDVIYYRAAQIRRMRTPLQRKKSEPPPAPVDYSQPVTIEGIE